MCSEQSSSKITTTNCQKVVIMIYCIDAVNGEPDTGDLEINLKYDYLFFSFDKQWTFM